MNLRERSGRLAMVLSLVLVPRTAFADPWDKVIHQLARGAEVVARSEAQLVIRAPGVERGFVFGTGRETGADIWFELEPRRGRNPYRVWYLRRSVLMGGDPPKRAWPRLLRVAFLRLLRLKPSEGPPTRRGETPSQGESIGSHEGR